MAITAVAAVATATAVAVVATTTTVAAVAEYRGFFGSPFYLSRTVRTAA